MVEGYTGLLCTVFATSCESIVIARLKAISKLGRRKESEVNKHTSKSLWFLSICGSNNIKIIIPVFPYARRRFISINNSVEQVLVLLPYYTQ